ncbi:MAG: DUF4235 domain-containing protein [Micrococcaceae bacterium]
MPAKKLIKSTAATVGAALGTKLAKKGWSMIGHKKTPKRHDTSVNWKEAIGYAAFSGVVMTTVEVIIDHLADGRQKSWEEEIEETRKELNKKAGIEEADKKKS